MRHAQHRAPPHRPAAPPAPTPRAVAAVRRVGLADLLERPRFEVLPTAGAPDAFADAPAARAVGDGLRLPEPKGLDATLDASVQLARPRLRRRPPPRRPHGQRRRPPQGDRRPPPRGRHHTASSSRAATPPSPAPTRTRWRCSRPSHAMGNPVPRRRHHRLPRVPPDDPRRRHHPGDVGQEPLRHRDGQQPDLRRRSVVETWLTRVRTRGVSLPLWLGVPGPGRPGQDARRRHPHRRRRLRALPA